MTKKHYLLNEVARLVGTAGYRIGYALANRHLPEPKERVNNHRLFTMEDIERIRKYFADPKTPGRKGVKE